MTEEEAKTKWCPFVQRTISRPDRGWTAFSSNRGNGDDCEKTPRCIASACMAWRWNDPWTSATEEGQSSDLVLRLKRKPGEPKMGFCGLAGATA